MTKQQHDELIPQLKDFHQSFTFQLEPYATQDFRLKAFTPFIAFTPDNLRKLADILEGRMMSVKRSGTKVKFLIW